MNDIDKQFLKTPYYGVQQMVYHFNNLDYSIGVKRVRRLMRLMGLQAIYQA
jgi:putative transposase